MRPTTYFIIFFILVSSTYAARPPPSNLTIGSGTEWFNLSWDNVSSHENYTTYYDPAICHIGQDCVLADLTVNNLTILGTAFNISFFNVSNFNISGVLCLNSTCISDWDDLNITAGGGGDFVKISGDTMTGNLTITDGTYGINITGVSIFSNTAYAPLLKLGAGSIADSSYSVALGLDAHSHNTSGVAIGSGASAYGVEGSALMAWASAGYRAVAFGYGATAAGDTSTAGGDASWARGDDSVAIGRQVSANGDTSLAMGYLSKAIGDYSVSIGRSTNSTGFNSYAFGDNVTIAGARSYGFGTDGISLLNDTFTLHNLNFIMDGEINGTLIQATNYSTNYCHNVLSSDAKGNTFFNSCGENYTWTVKNKTALSYTGNATPVFNFHDATLSGSRINALGRPKPLEIEEVEDIVSNMEGAQWDNLDWIIPISANDSAIGLYAVKNQLFTPDDAIDSAMQIRFSLWFFPGGINEIFFGDHINVTYDGGQKIQLFLPPGNFTYSNVYPDTNGNLYYNKELTELAQVNEDSYDYKTVLLGDSFLEGNVVVGKNTVRIWENGNVTATQNISSERYCNQLGRCLRTFWNITSNATADRLRVFT